MEKVVIKQVNNLNEVKSNTIGINGVLQILNIIIACLLISGLFIDNLNNHPYVNSLTLILGLLLCLQTHIALKLEKKNSDPFILIMVYLLILFYELRIFTLVHFPVQDVFLRFTYKPANTNFALFYILLSNIFLYLGFCSAKINNFSEISTGIFRVIKPRLGVMAFCFSIYFGNFVINKLPDGIMLIVQFIYYNFLTPNKILLILAAYVITFRHKLPSYYIKIIIVGGVVLLVLQTLSFSRSGLLTLFDNTLIVILALIPNVRIKRKFVVKGFFFLPLFITSAFAFYAISTVSRQMKGDLGSTFSEKLHLAKQSGEMLENDSRIDFYVGQALSRAAYFDYSSEIIANSDKYASIFSFQTYFKSIVDNILSPGFNVFDQPFLSNSLKYIHGNLGEISSKKEIESTYHTDQFGIYGEMYATFGFVSLIILYYVAFLFKKLFIYKGRLSPVEKALKNIGLITIFYQYMNSFGLDWLLQNTLMMFVIFYLFSKFFLIQFSHSKKQNSIPIINE
jgi:hypothetical protein